MSTDTMQPFEQSFTVVNSSNESFYAPAEADSNYLLETFHQFPHGDFRPTFYNPFEIKHRRRTSRAQLKVLEKSFSENSKPNATVRRILAQKLDMTPRGVQIWFQNRRAKAKLQRRKQSASEEQQKQQQPPSTNSATTTTTTFQNDEYGNNSDMDQSVLFSQFFANVQPQSTASGKPAFTSYLPPTGSMMPIKNETPAWGSLPWQQQQESQASDNVRSVATVAAAAAAAAAAASSSFETNPTFAPAIDNTNNWLNVPVHPLTHDDSSKFVMSGDDNLSRRKSCPATAAAAAADQSCLLAAQYSLSLPQAFTDQYKERRWSETDAASWGDNTSSNNNCCSFSGCNELRRDWSLEACSPLPDQISMDFYPLQDLTLDYPPVPAAQQYTPPLASSCSASTVSTSVTGSPISMDGYYESSNSNNTGNSSSGCFDCLIQQPAQSSSSPSSSSSVAEALLASTFA